MSEKNYDFRKRHWEYHKPDRRNMERVAAENEVMLDETWVIGSNADADSVCGIAVRDFRDYLEKSMNLSLRIVRENGEKVIWIEVDETLEKGFVLDVREDGISLSCADDAISFRATVHLEDLMNLEEAPVLKFGKVKRTPIYRVRQVHSGSGMDVFTDEEFLTMLHAGYNAISVFMSDFDRNRLGYYDYNDVINRDCVSESKLILTIIFVLSFIRMMLMHRSDLMRHTVKFSAVIPSLPVSDFAVKLLNFRARTRILREKTGKTV